MYYQFIMCLSIFLFGFFLCCIRGFPPLAPFATLTGSLWTLGNLLVIPIIQRVGIGMGLVFWSGSSMFTGWLISVLGGMGLKPQRDSVGSWPLNIAGVVVALSALVLATQMQTTIKPPSDVLAAAAAAAAADGDKHAADTDSASALAGLGSNSSSSFARDASVNGLVSEQFNDGVAMHSTYAGSGGVVAKEPASFAPGDRPADSTRAPTAPLLQTGDLSTSSSDADAFAGAPLDGGKGAGVRAAPQHAVTITIPADVLGSNNAGGTVTATSIPGVTASDRLVGVVMALVAGCFFGINFNGVQLSMERDPEASQQAIDYAFSHFLGIFIMSSIVFLLYCTYCVVSENKPPQIPGGGIFTPAAVVSGLMWALAQTAWFISNDALSQSITWPLIVVGPSAVGALWSVFFKEIQGRRNLTLLACVISASALSAGLVVASKK